MTVTKNKGFLDELSSKVPLHLPVLLQSPFIQLDSNEGMFNVQLKNILYCTSDSSVTTFYTRVTKPILISKPLKHFERLLRDYGFERLHHNLVINLTHIVVCRRKDTGYELELTGGEKIWILRAMKKKLTEALKRISIKEQRFSKKAGLHVMNEDFIIRDIFRSADFSFRYNHPQ